MKPSIRIAATGTALTFIAPNPVTVSCDIFNFFMLGVEYA